MGSFYLIFSGIRMTEARLAPSPVRVPCQQAGTRENPTASAVTIHPIDIAYDIAYDCSMDVTSYSASDARQNFYSLIKSASTGLKAIEINLRGSDPVLMINKAEVESWLETLDILSSPKEMKALRSSLKDSKRIPLDDLKKSLGI